jgi:hypothetical protein
MFDGDTGKEDGDSKRERRYSAPNGVEEGAIVTPVGSEIAKKDDKGDSSDMFVIKVDEGDMGRSWAGMDT